MNIFMDVSYINKSYKLCIGIRVEKKYYNIFVSLRCEMNIVILDVDSIKELATENFEPVNITSEGEKRPYYITNGEVILSNEQIEEILKNL